jgi:predicted SprT family Zn-dependent metalloprotease
MAPDVVDGRRVVLEIALNVDLLLSGNGRVRLDTMLHEMAHALDYLRNGNLDHGPSWRRIAAQVGCEPTPCTSDGFRRRRKGTQTVRRVPRLPAGVKRLLAA